MRKTIIITIIALQAYGNANAQTNWIYRWGMNDPGTCIIRQEQAKVEITSPGIFKLYAVQGAGYGYIDSITIPNPIEGDVYLYLSHPIYDRDAATYVNKIDLSNASYSEIKKVLVQDYVAAPDDGNEIRILRATRLSGEFTVRDIYDVYGSIDNDIEIEYLDADINCASMHDLTVAPPALLYPYVNTGSLTIHGPYADTVDLDGSMAGNIDIKGDMTGVIRVSHDLFQVNVRDLTGEIEVGNDLNWLFSGGVNTEFSGSLRIGHDLTCYDIKVGGGIYIWNDVRGSIEIGHDVGTDIFNPPIIYIVKAWPNDPPVTLYGDITIGGDLNGEMEIQGSLRDTLGDTSGGHIIVNGSFGWGEISIDDDYYGDTEYISIDYDGWDEYDEWSEYADVIIDGNVYNYNTPSARIWECMSCKGNVNNSGTDPDEEYGQLDPNDPNILAIAINDPNDYAALYPGLEGSLSWHGDVNCDESIDQDDLTALEWLLADDCCMKACQFRACYADIIESGQVDLSDLSQLLGNWGKTPAPRRRHGGANRSEVISDKEEHSESNVAVHDPARLRGPVRHRGAGGAVLDRLRGQRPAGERGVAACVWQLAGAGAGRGDTQGRERDTDHRLAVR